MGRSLLLSLCLLLCCISAIAQNNYRITGIISDKKETLPGAAIYISGYKMATVSNNEGKFTLSNLPAGNYDILVQLIGYLPYSKHVVINDQSVHLEIILTENATLLKEVVIKPDPNRAFYINLFKRFFIGESPNAKQCKILNTEVLSANDDQTQRVLSLTASDFLIIENQALGYRIKYLLKYFEYDYKTKIIFYAGHSSFEDLSGGSSKRKRWERNRAIAYHGSIQHFYKSLYQSRIAEEGFLIYKKTMIKNTKRLPDSVINTNIRRLTTGPNAVKNLITYNGGNDSLSYWLRQRKEPMELAVLNRGNVLLDTLVKEGNLGQKVMKFKDILYIVYKNESESDDYRQWGVKENRPPDLDKYQISLIQRFDMPIKFYESGVVDDPRTVLYSGYWNYEKVADLLPIDFVNKRRE